MIINDKSIIGILENDDEIKFREWWICLVASLNLSEAKGILEVYFKESGSTYSPRGLMDLIFNRKAYACFGSLTEIAGPGDNGDDCAE